MRCRSEQERALVEQIAGEIWTRMDDWIGLRVVGENDAIHALIGELTGAVRAARRPAHAAPGCKPERDQRFRIRTRL